MNIFLKLFFCLIPFSFVSSDEIAPRKTKLLVLIIASDHFSSYIEEQNLWRSYMHYNPEQIEAYFIKGDPNLEEDFKIEGDIIWSKTAETITPGVLNKTILSLEAMFPRLGEFDYVLRPNLSTFFVFPRLLNYLETIPKSRCSAGSIVNWNGLKESLGWPAKWFYGCGFVISSDVAQLMVTHKNKLIDSPIPDDVMMSSFIQEMDIPMFGYKMLQIGSMAQWMATKDRLPEDIFQFRLKQWNLTKRASDELVIMKEMIEKFYPDINQKNK